MQHGDVQALSIYANGLKQQANGHGKDVIHGDIREVSLVVAGANPGAFIDFVDLAHGEGAEQEVIIGTGEPISLYHSEDGGQEPAAASPKADSKPDGKSDETIEDVWNSLSWRWGSCSSRPPREADSLATLIPTPSPTERTAPSHILTILKEETTS